MWSNDAVADDPDDVSPWTRDDWVPDSSVPDSAVFGGGAPRSGGSSGARPPAGIFGEPPPEDFDDHTASSRSRLGRKVVAGAIVLALLIGSAGALLRGGGTSDDPSPPTTPSTEPATLEALRPVGASTTTGPATTLPAVPAPTGDAEIETEAVVPPVVIGEPPAWAERVVSVPESLAAIAPTEVITLSQTGILAVTEFPSGRTRSLDAAGSGSQLAFDDQTIVLFNSSKLLMIRDGEPIVEASQPDGIIFVQPWPGTGSFIVTTPATGPGTPEQEWVLRPDGSLERLDNRFVDESQFWSRAFSPNGDALIGGPGGVYAIAPDGDTRRISTGDLLAAGDGHWAIEECDDTLRCAYSVVSWDTGAVSDGMLESIDSLGFIDPATRISPDGRSIVYRADTDGTGRRRILDVSSGTSIEAGRINQLVYPDSWATDSSGLFVADRELQFVDRATGTVTLLDGFERIRTVATGPFSQ
jgi:hypothetical protein